MEGHSPEFNHQKQETTEQGYSEKRDARLREGKKMDDSQIKKRKPVIFAPKQKVLSRSRDLGSRKGKLLAACKQTLRELHILLDQLSQFPQGPVRQEELLVVDIRNKQKLYDELINALILEQKGQLVESSLSKSVQDLVK